MFGISNPFIDRGVLRRIGILMKKACCGVGPDGTFQNKVISGVKLNPLNCRQSQSQRTCVVSKWELVQMLWI
jgi:hypothetical protein